MKPIRSVLAVLAISFASLTTRAQTSPPAAPPDTGFSFAVYGDSRSMMYLPYKSEQEAEARELMTDLFDLVMPEKVAAELVQKDVKLIYDPATKELVQMVMPFMSKSEVTTLTLDKGWVTEASVEDVKLLPGVRRTMFRLSRRRMGCSRSRRRGNERAGEVHSQHRRHGLVGQAGSQAVGESGTGSWCTRMCSTNCPRRMIRCAPPGCRAAFTPLSAITKCGTTPMSKDC